MLQFIGNFYHSFDFLSWEIGGHGYTISVYKCMIGVFWIVCG